MNESTGANREEINVPKGMQPPPPRMHNVDTEKYVTEDGRITDHLRREQQMKEGKRSLLDDKTPADFKDRSR